MPLREPLHRVGALLARWHCWRRNFRTERSYARPAARAADPEDALEEMLMQTIEAEVERMPLPWQRMVGQLAQAECLGVAAEDIEHPGFAALLDHLAYRLRAAGIL